MNLHRHAVPEIYLVQSGSGMVQIGAEVLSVRAGSVAFIPLNAGHRITNTGSAALAVIWMFPTDRWSDISYTAIPDDAN